MKRNLSSHHLFLKYKNWAWTSSSFTQNFLWSCLSRFSHKARWCILLLENKERFPEIPFIIKYFSISTMISFIKWYEYLYYVLEHKSSFQKHIEDNLLSISMVIEKSLTCNHNKYIYFWVIIKRWIGLLVARIFWVLLFLCITVLLSEGKCIS